MIVREATEKDYNAIVALLAQLNPNDLALDKSAGSKIFHSVLTNDCLSILLAEVDGKVVSSCYLNVIPNLTRGGRSYALIENVVTDEAYRRRGIGANLLTQVIEKSFDLGCYKVMLLTGRDKSVHTFYENCGMEKDSKTAFIKVKR